MKKKDKKFYLSTVLIIVTYYLIFNFVARLEFVNQLSDFGFYGFQILLIVLEGIAATVVLVKSQGWKECCLFQCVRPMGDDKTIRLICIRQTVNQFR